MFVNEAAARKMFAALGKEEAGEWSRKRLLLKLNNLPSEVGDETPKEKADKVLFRAICKALEMDEKIEYEKTEEEKKEEEKPAPKKRGRPASSETKPEEGNGEEKPKKERKKRERSPDAAPSNKEVVYKLWEKAKDKSTKEAEKYHEKVGQAVKLTTIKSWISAWGRGNNLPACAR